MAIGMNMRVSIVLDFTQTKERKKIDPPFV